ncbi:Membrane protein OS=Streptomyces microflavus OX=1919 GN=Smic_40730 PE=4 SV=1 [Streptomyces microflavus]
MRRRRRDARAVGPEAARVPELERRIANGELPEDPAEQAVMVRLIRRREEKLRRNQWWAFPLLG